jgi:hypothetical protein
MDEHEQFPPAPEEPEIGGEEGVLPDEERQPDIPFPWPPEGQRTAEQQAQVELWEKTVAWLETKWSRSDGEAAPCPYCGTRQWSVGLPTLPVTYSGPPFAGFAPVVPVMCLNCGNTVFINAILSGLLPPPSNLDTPPGGSS